MGGLIENYIRELFEERDVSEASRKKLWKKYYTKLSKAVDKGYNPNIEQYNPELAHKLKYNIAEFSSFKETSFRKELEGLLTKNGKIVPWSKFKEKVLAISGEYNKRWLETEYHQTVASANMAGKWEDFQQNKDLYPNLKYVTAGDSRVRAKHQQWDGLILPINHPWWDSHYPPDDWGCRCNAVQTDEEVSPDIPSGEVKKGFANNVGKTGKVFPKSAYESTLNKTGRKEALGQLDSFLADEKNLIDTQSKNVKISLGADQNDLYRNYHVAKIAADQLDMDFILRTHVEVQNTKNPEYLILKKYLGDRKSIEGLNNMRSVIDRSKKQMLHPSVNPNKTPYYIVWDFDKIKILDIDEIIRSLQRKVNQERGRWIKGMVFQYKGKAVHLSREEIVKRKFEKLYKLK